MAKKQTFGDKLSKKSKSKRNVIKLIRSFLSKKGSVRFSEDILQVPEDKTPENIIKEFVQSK